MTTLQPQLDPPHPAAGRTPFDARKLDALLEQAGLDAVLATSTHSVRHLLGGGGEFHCELAEANGLGSSVPAVAYRRGEAADALYVGVAEQDTDGAPLWIGDVRAVSHSAAQTGDELVRWCAAHLPRSARVGVELAHLPTASYACLAARGIAVLDASDVLEQLRAVKRPQELERVRRTADAAVDALLATFRTSEAGETKAAIVERLRREQAVRGLTPRFALATAGAERSRAPSPRRVVAGEVLSLAAGATLDGWAACVGRMGIAGAPTQRHRELLERVELMLQSVRALACPGVLGGELLAAGESAAACVDGTRLSFAAHGLGLLFHEAPHLRADGRPAVDAERALETGMVLSLAAQAADPHIGLVRLEDVVIVGNERPELVAGHGRDWNPLGS